MPVAHKLYTSLEYRANVRVLVLHLLIGWKPRVTYDQPIRRYGNFVGCQTSKQNKLPGFQE
jgi:hypothetical protein